MAGENVGGARDGVLAQEGSDPQNCRTGGRRQMAGAETSVAWAPIWPPKLAAVLARSFYESEIKNSSAKVAFKVAYAQIGLNAALSTGDCDRRAQFCFSRAMKFADS